eukprot:818349-Pyramimonas_sp.AAC.1
MPPCPRAGAGRLPGPPPGTQRPRPRQCHACGFGGHQLYTNTDPGPASPWAQDRCICLLAQGRMAYTPILGPG